MAFDVQGAKAAGYSDAEIADHLAEASKFDTAGARKAGYTDAELIAHLSAPAAPSALKTGSPLLPSWLGGRGSPAPPAPASSAPGPPVAASPGLDREMPTLAGNLPSETPGVPAPPGADISTTIRTALAPAPNTTYGSVVPLAKDNTTGEIRLALPSMIRSPLIGLTQEGGQPTINPDTGTLGITPEAASVAGFAASPLRIGAPGAIPATLAAREAPLTPAFQENAFTPMATARVAETPPGAPVTVPGPTTPNAFAPAASTEAAPVSATGIPRTAPPPTPPAASPEGTPGPATSAAPSPAATPRTVPEAKAVASAYYGISDAAGGAQFPDAYVNNLVDAFKRAAPQGEAGRTLFGDTVPAQLAAKAESLRGKPMTLADAQEIDEGIGSLISNQYRPNGQLTDEGRVLFDLQSELRDLTMHAAPTTEAAGGVEALKAGRAAWSQAQKMQDLQRIWDRAQMNERPDTAFRTGVRTLLSNEKRVRGYSDEEKAAVRAAADRGSLGEVLHVFGSKLIPIGAGLAEASSGGLTAGLAAATTAHIGTAGFRNLSTRLQARRFENAMGILGRRVPPMPSNDLYPR